MNIDIPQVLLVALLVVVTGALLVGGATSSVAFDSFNPDWDGTSDFRTTAEESGSEPVIIRNTTRYDAYGDGDVALVLAPDRAYNETEAAAVRRFVERGGTLIVADRDGPYGHDLLAAVGADARPDGALLRDERNHHRSPALPIANEVSNHSLVADVESVTLNYGTAVEPNNATVLVATSPYAYLDRDGSGSISDNETAASYPVATVESIGDGRVVTVGDPSLFINVMQDDLGNRPFVIALLDDADHALIDISHGSSPPPLVALLLTIRESLLVQLGLGIGGLLAIGASGRVLGRRETETSDAPDETTLAAGFERLYPDLAPKVRDRLTKGVSTTRTEYDDNE